MRSPSFWHRLLFTAENHLDLSWAFCLTVLVALTVAFLGSLLFQREPSPTAWATMGGVFMAVLIAAVPISKARLLAQSRLPSSFASAIDAAKAAGVRAPTPSDQSEADGVDPTGT